LSFAPIGTSIDLTFAALSPPLQQDPPGPDIVHPLTHPPPSSATPPSQFDAPVLASGDMLREVQAVVSGFDAIANKHGVVGEEVLTMRQNIYGLGLRIKDLIQKLKASREQLQHQTMACAKRHVECYQWICIF
jgi:hypothetical protein